MKWFRSASTKRRMPSPADATYRRYLLGQLHEAERDALEQRLFAEDDALTPELLAAEDDLVDDYVSKDLTPDDRRLFEETLLRLPSRRQKVALAADLVQAARRRPPGRGQRARVRGALAASLLAAVWGTWFWRHRSPEPATPAPPATPSAAAPSSSTVRVVLLAGVVRSASTAPTVHLRPEVRTVELQAFLEIDGSVPTRGRAQVARASGGEVWSDDVRLETGSEGVHAQLTVPATVLAAGDYLVTVTAPPAGELASYALRVVR
jgi:hypothetical protein